MSILAVGSFALDSVVTPFGQADRVLGGSAVFFSAAASILTEVNVVGVVGDDFPLENLSFLKDRGVDLTGIETEEGESFSWSASYHSDMNTRDTIETKLGVFEGFDPKIPEQFRQSDYVFLGNIDPVLQHKVLDQVTAPSLVACDTMNHWIESEREELIRLLNRVDLLLVNDEEARQLSGETGLVDASRLIQKRGPRMVVIKKGEHGAVLFSDDSIFSVPAFPLPCAFDPTGAGDAFAGGLLGHISEQGFASVADLRRAMAFGSVLGSFAVQEFSIEGLRTLSKSEILERVRALKVMTTFDMNEEG